MKTYGEGEVIAPPFLTSGLDGGEWSASRLWYPLGMRLDEPQSRSGRCGEEENLTMLGIETGLSSP
jgi:hypothetical protein